MNRVTALLALIVMPAAVTGHHSNAEYDFSAFEELEGEIVTVSWKNPHVRLTLRSPGDGGTAEIWDLEAQDVNSLGRRGLGADLIQVGDTVKVAGNPSSRRVRTMFVTNVLLPSGTEIRTRGNTTPRWSAAHVGFDEPIVDDIRAGAEAATGLFRVWMSESGGFPRDLPLTPTARETQVAWDDPADDLTRQCIAPGMPGAMSVSRYHPIDFREYEGQIVLRDESFDIVRTIDMRSGSDASRQPVTPLGYSQGHWEGGTLVVRTTRVNWPYFNDIGSIPQSEAVEITERFTVNEDDNQLLYDLTVSDTATFTEPVSARWVLGWRPDLVVEPYECTLDG